MWSIIENLLDRIFPYPENPKPPCFNLFWGLPDDFKIVVGKEQKMKPNCELGLKTRPTCGGLFGDEPRCNKYPGENKDEL